MGRSVGVPGRQGSALDFDGNDDYILISDDDSLDINNSFTLETILLLRLRSFDFKLRKRFGSLPLIVNACCLAIARFASTISPRLTP